MLSVTSEDIEKVLWRKGFRAKGAEPNPKRKKKGK